MTPPLLCPELRLTTGHLAMPRTSLQLRYLLRPFPLTLGPSDRSALLPQNEGFDGFFFSGATRFSWPRLALRDFFWLGERVLVLPSAPDRARCSFRFSPSAFWGWAEESEPLDVTGVEATTTKGDSHRGDIG